jgi:hypothetical protein
MSSEKSTSSPNEPVELQNIVPTTTSTKTRVSQTSAQRIARYNYLNYIEDSVQFIIDD